MDDVGVLLTVVVVAGVGVAALAVNFSFTKSSSFCLNVCMRVP